MGVYQLGPRKAMYTDDGQSSLALAASIVEKGTVDPLHCAKSYAEFFRHEPTRGYPGTAKAVLVAVEGGADIRTTGTIAFPDGSYANGGAMRIGPVGLAYRNADDAVLLEAVRQAILSSHVHPDAIEGAFVIAKAVAVLLKARAEKLDMEEFLRGLLALCKQHEMKWRIEYVIQHFKSLPNGLPRDEEWSDRLQPEVQHALKLGGDFQIAATEAVSVALLALAVHYREPEAAIAAVMGYGGDVDTTGCILGFLLGALHGSMWIPATWRDQLENGEFGRDYCIRLAHAIAKLDVHDQPAFV
jgi:poly(ADP-ribose) glycohydrolase ARH3